jgi:hypothetical protein
MITLKGLYKAEAIHLEEPVYDVEGLDSFEYSDSEITLANCYKVVQDKNKELYGTKS